MNRTAGCVLLIAAGIGFFASGCHKTDAKAELEKVADTFAKSDAPGPAVPVPDQTPVQQPTAVPAEATPAAAPNPPPQQMMNQALASYKSGNFEDAVTRLQLLRSTPTLTPEQRMALQDGIAAVMAEVYALAEKGDQRAVQAVKQYETMQTMPHR